MFMALALNLLEQIVSWFRNHEIHDEENWMFLGDFNFYRSLSNRNKPGGCLSDTFIFNDAIGHLGLVDVPLKGIAFTWSNMQADPLLEQLDWFFTSANWTIDYPNTEVLPMTKITFDHIPCKVVISTSMPRSNIFRFENYWVEQDDFIETVQNSWLTSPTLHTATKTISSKFKNLRSALKSWSKKISNLKLLISNCNAVICFLDGLEDRRGLFNPEINLRSAVRKQLEMWLKCKNLYWRKRYTVNRIKLGDECIKFFHGMATISYRHNSISQLLNEHGVWVQDHESKAGLLWNSFKSWLVNDVEMMWKRKEEMMWK